MRSDRFWIAENGVPFAARTPKEGGVDVDRLALLAHDAFGRNIPSQLTVIEAEDDKWVDRGLLDAFLTEVAK